MTVAEKVEARIQAAYATVPEHIKADTVDAAIWARSTLTHREGAGHEIHVTAEVVLGGVDEVREEMGDVDQG